MRLSGGAGEELITKTRHHDVNASDPATTIDLMCMNYSGQKSQLRRPQKEKVRNSEPFRTFSPGLSTAGQTAYTRQALQPARVSTASGFPICHQHYRRTGNRPCRPGGLTILKSKLKIPATSFTGLTDHAVHSIIASLQGLTLTRKPEPIPNRKMSFGE